MNPEQTKYLKNRLMESASHKENNRKDDPMPFSVKRASKIVESWQKKQYAKRRRFRSKLYAAKAKVREIILFGDPDKALKALKDFESKKFY